MGYLRFGAIGAMLLARLCSGISVPLDGPEITILLSVLLAEIVEDGISYTLWYCGVDLSPPSLLVSEQEVEAMATTRLSRRKGSKEAQEPRKGSEGSTVTPTAVVPTSGGGQGGQEPSQAESENLLKSTCWSTRVAYDFRYRIEAFERMPLWGHLLPAAMAQFHTIFAMAVFAHGLESWFCLASSFGDLPGEALFLSRMLRVFAELI